MRLPAAGDDRGDPAGGQLPPVLHAVVGPVGKQVAGAAAWPSPAAADRRDRLDEPDELGDVVTVPAGHDRLTLDRYPKADGRKMASAQIGSVCPGPSAVLASRSVAT